MSMSVATQKMLDMTSTCPKRSLIDASPFSNKRAVEECPPSGPDSHTSTTYPDKFPGHLGHGLSTLDNSSWDAVTRGSHDSNVSTQMRMMMHRKPPSHRTVPWETCERQWQSNINSHKPDSTNSRSESESITTNLDAYNNTITVSSE